MNNSSLCNAFLRAFEEIQEEQRKQKEKKQAEAEVALGNINDENCTSKKQVEKQPTYQQISTSQNKKQQGQKPSNELAIPTRKKLLPIKRTIFPISQELIEKISSSRNWNKLSQMKMEEEDIDDNNLSDSPLSQQQDQISEKNSERSRQKQQSKFDKYQQTKNKNLSHFDPKPYVMRRIKRYIKDRFIHTFQRDGKTIQLDQQYFRRNINEGFYRDIVFKNFSGVINRYEMLEAIKSQWSRQKSQKNKLILDEVKRIKTKYTYDIKTIQRTMWHILIVKFDLQREPLQNFKRQNFAVIYNILNRLLYAQNVSEIQRKQYLNAFWFQVNNQLKEKNPLKYDIFYMENIRKQYFPEA